MEANKDIILFNHYANNQIKEKKDDYLFYIYIY